MSARRWLASCLVVVAIGATTIGSPEPAGAQRRALEVHAWPPTSGVVSGACESQAVLRVQELGTSGVTRFRVMFERRAPQDSTGLWFLAYERRGWYRSLSFPDDERSFYWDVGVTMRYPAGGRYRMWAKVVGERPSLWQRDLVRYGRIGEIGCSLEELHSDRGQLFG